jgi:HAD superfamily hydrolase (TIGR01490 family)
MLNKITVAFDLDGTLIAVDSAQVWLDLLVEQNISGAKKAHQVCSQIMQSYGAGTMDMAEYMSAWLQPLNGFDLVQIQPLVKAFIEQVVTGTVYSQGIKKLRWHQQQGHEIVIISASPSLIVRPIAQLLGIENSIGIEVKMQNNTITQLAIPPFSFKQGKVTAIEQWLAALPSTQLDYAYSDSINDLPLLKLAQQGFCVNPDDKLQLCAKDNAWLTYQWHKTE